MEPKDFKSAEFKDTGGSNAIVRLTPAMRSSKGNHLTGFYYICMFAHLPASYVLTVEETVPGKQWERIEYVFALQ